MSKKKSKRKSRLAQFEAQTWLNGRVIGSLLDRTNELAAVMKKMQEDQVLDHKSLEYHASDHRMNDAEMNKQAQAQTDLKEAQNNQALDVVALAQRLSSVEKRMDAWVEQETLDEAQVRILLKELRDHKELYARDTRAWNDAFVTLHRGVEDWRAAGKADNEHLTELRQQVPLLIKALGELTAMRAEVEEVDRCVRANQVAFTKRQDEHANVLLELGQTVKGLQTNISQQESLLQSYRGQQLRVYKLEHPEGVDAPNYSLQGEEPMGRKRGEAKEIHPKPLPSRGRSKKDKAE